jgi:hypothetical protein
MIDQVQVQKPFIQEFIQKPEVQLGLKITGIALAAIALIVGISVPVSYMLPIAPIAAILTLRVSVILIVISSIELFDLAYKDFKKQRGMENPLF